MRIGHALALLALTGCPWVGTDDYRDNVQDADGDGVVAVRFGGRDCQDDNPAIGNCDADDDGFLSQAAGGDDCDDTSADVHPGAVERCDRVDNDCDGAVDNQDPDVQPQIDLWIDADGDGEGDPDRPIACQVYTDPDDPESGLHARNADDCDDADAAVNTNAEELCDGFDNNCDGAIDDVGLWLLDDDGDGYGRDGTQASGSCDLSDTTGLAAVGGDCDDTDPDVHAGATEVPYDGVDQNCNGLPDDWDQDLDGFVPEEHWSAAELANQARPENARWNLAPGDCDDLRAAVNPDADEVCDGRDNDCDGAVDAADLQQDDEDPLLLAQVIQVYVDRDGDGEGGTLARICPQNFDDTLHFEEATDCFDSGVPPVGFENALPAQVYAGAEELCDGFDNDCDGNVDWSAEPFTGSAAYYEDGDGDGFGDVELYACSTDATAGIVSTPGDCDDGDEGRFPGAPEICGNAVREDCAQVCDGDDCVPASPFDCDLDGFLGQYNGGPTVDPAQVDCEDQSIEAFPGGTEVCDGLDNDCNGAVDADDDNVDDSFLPTWYVDVDGDGFGDDDGPTAQQCTAPGPDYALVAGDCDDTDGDLNPGAPWYLDKDGDGYGTTSSRVITGSCASPPVSSQGTWVRSGGDCNDNDARYSPGTIWFEDADGDFVGTATSTHIGCAPPSTGAWVLATVGEDCNDNDASVQGTREFWVDSDGDGYGDPDATPTTGCSQPPPGSADNDDDCDDTNSAVNPNRIELCNALDDDCDGLVDDADNSITGATGPLAFRDADGDGFGDGDVQKRFCFAVPASGWTEDDTDCDDTASDVNPAMVEVCGDPRDEDCDGDNGEPVWYLDLDQDGFGDGTPTAPQCTPPSDATYASKDGDCDDDEPTTYPGAPELDACDAVDSDCDGSLEPRLTWTYDADGDTYGDDDTAIGQCTAPSRAPTGRPTGGTWVLRSGDCDDDDLSVTFGRVFYVDADDDGIGDAAGTVFACPPDDPTDPVYIDVDGDGTFDPAVDVSLQTSDGDCDDADASIGAAESFYRDGDFDGYGIVPGVLVCEDVVDAHNQDPARTFDWVQQIGDCDDDDDERSPALQDDPAAPDGKDNDCDGLVDNDNAAITWYIDADGDGFGAQVSASYVPGAVTRDGDCDDSEPRRNPGYPEVCDGVPDNDCSTSAPWPLEERDDDFDGDGITECDGDQDDDDASVDVPQISWYRDLDGDGYGDTASRQLSPTFPGNGWIATPGDCDDNEASVHPGAGDTSCDGIDQDCNGIADDQATRFLWYPDGDGDGYGAGGPPQYSCADPLDGSVTNVSDCDDSDAGVNPGVPEVACNGIDDDCDGVLAAGEEDADSDGYLACADDCDDNESRRNPGRAEICDGVADNDCSEPDDLFVIGERDHDFDGDGVTECEGDADDDDATLGRPVLSWFYDADGDGYGDDSTRVEAETRPAAGYRTVGGDCDDSSATINPSATDSTCDGVDDDCDGRIDELATTSTWYLDDDGDGYGRTRNPLTACAAPAGYIATDGDCDDTRLDAYPGAAELCNGLDDDCDGSVEPDEVDVDRDGAFACQDCDDQDAFTYPGAPERCDGLQNDCDAAGLPADEADVDGDGSSTCEGDPDDADANVFPTDPTWFYDGDGDGYGGELRQVSANRPGSDWVALDGDCDDDASSVNPGAFDSSCDGVDDDCNGLVDDAALGSQGWWPDRDGDGYGDSQDGGLLICSPPDGYVDNANDCDDYDAATHPGAPEICDGRANDCGFQVPPDEVDGDGDGFLACEDCDDTEGAAYPGAPELCDGITDNDCDGDRSDDPDDDLDGDGFTECQGDTNDADANTYPVARAWYPDTDGDGYGAGQAVYAIIAPQGSSPSNDDCDDSRDDVNPGRPNDATCDGIDDDCDELIDEDTSQLVDFWPDGDFDGYGDTYAQPVQACSGQTVSGHVEGDSSDCDDTDPARNPLVTESCNGLDDDCDGDLDPFEADVDGDGFLACLDDCDDSDGQVNPGIRLERCNGADDDCDGAVDLPNPHRGTVVQNDGDRQWVTIDKDGNGTSSIRYLSPVCTEIDSPLYVPYADGSSATLYPIEGLGSLAAADDCEDGSFGTVVFADVDADGVPHAEGPGEVALNDCGAPPVFGYIPLDPTVGMDCAPDDTSRFYSPREGDYLDVDGDAEISVVPFHPNDTYDEVCVGDLPSATAGTDCQDNPNTWGLPVRSDAVLADVLATCDNADILLDHQNVIFQGTPLNGADLRFYPLDYSGQPCDYADTSGCGNGGYFQLAPGSRISVTDFGLAYPTFDVEYADASLTFERSNLVSPYINAYGQVEIREGRVDTFGTPAANLWDYADFRATNVVFEGAGYENMIEANLTYGNIGLDGSSAYNIGSLVSAQLDGGTISLTNNYLQGLGGSGVFLSANSYSRLFLTDNSYWGLGSSVIHAAGDVEIQSEGDQVGYPDGSYIKADDHLGSRPYITARGTNLDNLNNGTPAFDGGSYLSLSGGTLRSGDASLVYASEATVEVADYRLENVFSTVPLIDVSRGSNDGIVHLTVEGLSAQNTYSPLVRALNVDSELSDISIDYHGATVFENNGGSMVLDGVTAERLYGSMFDNGAGSILDASNLQANEIDSLGLLEGLSTLENVVMEDAQQLLKLQVSGSQVFLDQLEYTQLDAQTFDPQILLVNDTLLVLSNAELHDLRHDQTVGFQLSDSSELQIDRSLIWSEGGSPPPLFNLAGTPTLTLSSTTVHAEGNQSLFYVSAGGSLNLYGNLLYNSSAACTMTGPYAAGADNWIFSEDQADGIDCTAIPLSGAGSTNTGLLSTGDANFSSTRVPLNSVVRNGWGVRKN